MRVFVVPLVLTLGCADRVDAVLALDGDAAAGATVYSETCAACHGASGEGDIGPDLADHVPEHDDHALVELMLEGIGDEMPSFEDREDQELADLLAPLRATLGEYEGDGHDHEH